ncbi:MAG TPA: peptidoglycan editing factor PgeF [Polyangiaceae bacterium]|jgi:hypothetical protein
MNRNFYLQSSLLAQSGFQHAFFTRLGGVSDGVYRSLNFSLSVGDSENNVEENFSCAAEVLGTLPSQICHLAQVHGAVARVLEKHESRDQVRMEQADALVSLAAGPACGVLTADCVPILMGDRLSGAAAAIHVGWRGAVRGVIRSAVAQLRHALGAEGDLIAAIGPRISALAFEVSEEVAAQLQASSPGDEVVLTKPGFKPHVDLGRLARAQLSALGVAEERVDEVGGCTLSVPDLYYSYRRDGPRSGRHLSAIVPRR